MNTKSALVLALSLLPLAACSSLSPKVSQLHVGNTKKEVRAVMGPAPYSKEEGDLAIWQYAEVAGFGYCEYKKIWFWKGKVTSISGYNHISIAGCTAGLKHIDWEAAMESAPITDDSPVIRSDDTSPVGPQPSAVAISPATIPGSPSSVDAMCDLSSPVEKAECRGELVLGMTTNEIIKALGKPDEMSADGTMLRYGDRYLSLDEKSRLVGIADRPPSGR